MSDAKKSIRRPRGGYDFPEKRFYRHWVWKGLAQYADIKRGQVLVMPSSDPSEVRVARQYGANIARMHVVDYSAQAIANMTRKLGGRAAELGHQRYSMDVAEACETIANKGHRLSAANFDFTSNLDVAQINRLQRISWANPFAANAAIAVTASRGREAQLLSSAWLYGCSSDLLTQLVAPLADEEDARRLSLIGLLFMLGTGRTWQAKDHLLYASGKRRMLVGIFVSGMAIPGPNLRAIRGVWGDMVGRANELTMQRRELDCYLMPMWERYKDAQNEASAKYARSGPDVP